MDELPPTTPTPPAAPVLPPPPRPPRFRLYIGESGDHTYNKLDEPAHRYLALLGVWFRKGDEYNAFTNDLERFKETLFGQRPDNPVVLHRSDISNREGAFGILCDENKRNLFDAGLLEIINRARFKMKKTPFGASLTPALTGYPPAVSRIAEPLQLKAGRCQTENGQRSSPAQSRSRAVTSSAGRKPLLVNVLRGSCAPRARTRPRQSLAHPPQKPPP